MTPKDLWEDFLLLGFGLSVAIGFGAILLWNVLVWVVGAPVRAWRKR
jgi:hypothetical protein